ncbi:CopG family transcriptional regulator [Kitasatospora sp. NPDC088779]|uniref:ribbon-helix-helix domain-containing protein n=1 Tax=unclassified Kitasatospora TaxID=2633591 RepID=UPI00341DC1A7
MARVDVHDYYDPTVDEPAVVSRFDPGAAEKFPENTRWDKRLNRQVGVNAGGVDGYHQALYRTAGGKWVLQRWREGAENQARYQFLDDSAARTWLRHNEEEDAVRQFFGERDKGGRPKIGEKKRPTDVKLPESLLDAVDEQAAEAGVTRAEMLRRLIRTGHQVGSYRALGRPDDLWRFLREADDWLRENREGAQDAGYSVDERVFNGTAYYEYVTVMSTALNAAREAFAAEMRQAREVYARAEAAEPEDSKAKALATAWGRTMGLDTADEILQGLQAMLPMGAYHVMARADMDDPTADLDA